jgi:nucleoside-diphosphate-sugar epimerase
MYKATGDRPARVVVTGAAGFIASHLVDALLEAGCEVAALDVRTLEDEAAAHNLAYALKSDRFELHRIDLANDELEPVLRGAHVVFHLAGRPGVRESWGSGFDAYLGSNVLATSRLLAACEVVGIERLVYASSSSVYGSVEQASREDDLTAPVSPYGVTKLAGEHLCLAHSQRADTRMSTVCLRYFTVYGPRQRPGMAISKMLLGALMDTAFPLFGDGRQRREFTYVADVVRATLAAAYPEVPSTVINVGGGTSISMLELIDEISHVAGSPLKTLQLQQQPGDVVATEADLTRAQQLLGYKPIVNITEGLEHHAEWLRSLPEDVLKRLMPTHLLEGQG